MFFTILMYAFLAMGAFLALAIVALIIYLLINGPKDFKEK